MRGDASRQTFMLLGVTPDQLVPARTDTQWWTVLADAPTCFVRGRLKFSGHNSSAPLPSALIYLGPDPAKFAAVFGSWGQVVNLPAGQRQVTL